MPESNQLNELTDQITMIESEGAAISAGWYEEKPTRKSEVDTLAQNCTRALSTLQSIEKELDKRIRATATSDARDKLQYAYNLVRELTQSRQANLELLQVILHDGSAGTAEYFRAFSVKERAAQEQCKKLQDTLRGLS